MLSACPENWLCAIAEVPKKVRVPWSPRGAQLFLSQAQVRDHAGCWKLLPKEVMHTVIYQGEALPEEVQVKANLALHACILSICMP